MLYNSETKSLPPAKFLTIAANLLKNSLLDASRTEAKGKFRDILAGKVVPLTYLELEDKALVRFDLSMNHDMYRGNLNFTNFRNSIALFIGNAGAALKAPEELRILHNQENPRSLVFNVFAITMEDGEPSVLSLVVESSETEAAVHLQLTFLDTVQFKRQQEQQAAQEDVGESGDANNA